MNTKVLSSLSAALVVASFVPPAMAESLGTTPDLHWSAAIGTGHTARATDSTSSVKPNAATPASQRQPASPDWTATIGTGTAATSRSAEPDGSGSLSSASRPTVAVAHWTSRIGSGHPFDSASSVTYTAVANSR